MWKVENQTIRFTQWTEEFDPDGQRSTNVLLWVRFPELKQQFSDYEVLMTLGKALGTPIGIEKRTLDREYCYLANILVDIDMSKPVATRFVSKKIGVDSLNNLWKFLNCQIFEIIIEQLDTI